ncbi:MAG TPA: HAD family acid phosphatase [Candidatus Wallbacteria bacterium]|nr:HAD family acid phosphatase [Candidatus Wallbacteria bacterium]
MIKNSLFKRLNLILFVIFSSVLLFSGQAAAYRDSQIPNLEKIKQMIINYRNSGDWARELEVAGDRGIEMFYKAYDKNEKQAVVFDIDETTVDNYEYYEKNGFAFVPKVWFEWLDSAKAPAIKGVKRIYDEAVKKGVPVFFVTGRSEKGRASAEKNLMNAGYSKYEKLIMRSPEEKSLTALKYKSQKRENIEKSGYHIILNVGDQYSDLFGGYSENILKLPNPMYFIQ